MGLTRGCRARGSHRGLAPPDAIARERRSADMGETRAGDRTRTGDLLHGKQTLYQLSYARALNHAPTGSRTRVTSLKGWCPNR